MKYEAIDWDDAWAALVDPIVEAHENDKPRSRLEEKYDRRYVESANCRLYTERLIENLRAKNAEFVFAAHTDATAWPRNSWWRIVVRKGNGQPVPGAELGKLKRAAKAILRNIEEKYPGVGAKEQEAANKAAEDKLKADYAKMGLKLSFPKTKRGCLLCLIWPF